MGPLHRTGLPREGGLARAKVIATERLAGFFQEKGVAFVDAPVSGGVIGAEQGTLLEIVKPLIPSSRCFVRSAATSSMSARARAWAKP
jgi:hypothetical protein